VPSLARDRNRRVPVTPVHPEPTVDGFRIVVPLASESGWARNVIAAGHCRLQLHDIVDELDEPRMISPHEVDGIPRVVRLLQTALGFRFLALRTFAAATGQLDEFATHDEAIEGREVFEAVDAPLHAALSSQPRSRPEREVSAAARCR
jgi:hypothetical protein